MNWNDEIQSLDEIQTLLNKKLKVKYKPNRHIKVIVGDYSKYIAMNTNYILKSLGLETEFVSNGTDLVSKVSNNEKEYDIVITNNQYYEEVGERVLYEIKKKGIKIPVIVATGEINERQKFLKKGFDGYLEKPVGIEETKEELLKVIPSLNFIKL